MKDWIVLDSDIIIYALSKNPVDEEKHRAAKNIIEKNRDCIVICPLVAFEVLQNPIDEEERKAREQFCLAQISPEYDLASAQFAAEIRQRIKQESKNGNPFPGEDDVHLPKYTMDVQIMGYAYRWKARYLVSGDKRSILRAEPLVKDTAFFSRHKPQTEIKDLNDPIFMDPQLPIPFEEEDPNS